MWDLFKKEGLSGAFSGGITNIKDKISKNLISETNLTKLKDSISEFKQLTNESLSGNTFDKFLSGIKKLDFPALTTLFSDLAREGKNAEINIRDCYAAILDGNTRGIGNVADIIKTFNESIPEEDQKDFADAVAETNVNLGDYLKSTEAGEASLGGYGLSLVGAKLKTVALTVATTALNTAISLGISVAIQGLITLISNAINAFDNAIDKAENAKTQISESQKNIESLNSELSDTKRRLNELSKIQAPTLFEQDEINRLKEYNAQLEKQIALEERNIKIAQQEAREESLTAWDTIAGGWTTFFSGQNNAFTVNYLQGKTFDQNQANLNNYSRLLKQINGSEAHLKQLVSQRDQFASEELYQRAINGETSRLEEMRKQANDLEDSLTSFVNTIEIIRDGLDPERDQETINILNSFIDTFNRLDNTKGKNQSFTDVWNSPDFVLVTDRLKELAKQKNLTDETFKNVRGIEDFLEALRQNGVDTDDISEIIRAINNEIQGTDSSSEQAALSVSQLNTSLESLKETIDATLSSQSTLQSAFDKMQEGTSLSADEVLKLVEIYPELASQFKRTVDGYKISSKALLAANEDITSSTRESVTEQIEGYQKVIDNYNKLKSVSGMPENVRNERLQELGVTPKEIEDAEQQIEYLNFALGILNANLDEDASQVDKLKNKAEELAKTASSMSSKMKAMSSAFKEQKESGQLSADTILTLIDNGYAAALMYDRATGAVKLNEQAYLNLAKAELAEHEADLQTQISNAELELLNAKRGIVSNLGWSYLGAAEGALKLAEAEAVINNNPELIENLKAQLVAVQDLKNNLQSVITGEYGNSSGSSDSDTIDQAKQDFDDLMNDWQLQYDRGLITAETYYSKLAEANEKFYKDCIDHADDYESNLTKIWEHEKDEWDKKAEAEKNALADQLSLGYIDQKAYDAGIVDIAERYYGNKAVLRSTALGTVEVSSTEWGQDNYKSLTDEASKNDQEQYKEEFQKELDDLNKLLERGFITTAEWRQRYADLRNNWWGENSDWYGTSFASDMYKEMSGTLEDVDDLYDEQLANLQKANDKSIESEWKFIEEWGNLNARIYGDPETSQYNLTKYKANLKEIADAELALLDREYTEGLISAREYFDKVTELWEKNKDILGANTLGEWLEDAWDKRIADEKTYWEQQAKIITDRYDKEIDALQKIKDEKEKISKAEETYLNLIKARQELEDTKNQRNQLVISNGMLYYDYDQDAVLSAEEALREAEKEAEDSKLQEQIDLLTDQRDNELVFYTNIIALLDEYINETRQILASDPEALERVLSSDVGQYYLEQLNSTLSADKVPERIKKTLIPDGSQVGDHVKETTELKVRNQTNTQKETEPVSEPTNEETANASIEKWESSFLGKTLSELADIATNCLSLIQGEERLALESSYAQDTLSSAINNVYNNSTLSDDHSVNVGDIHMTIQGGTSQDMLTQFAEQLGSAITSLLPQGAI